MMLELFFISGRYHTAKLDLSMSQMGNSRPMHSVPVPINVRCYSKTTLLFAAAK